MQINILVGNNVTLILDVRAVNSLYVCVLTYHCNKFKGFSDMFFNIVGPSQNFFKTAAGEIAFFNDMPTAVQNCV